MYEDYGSNELPPAILNGEQHKAVSGVLDTIDAQRLAWSEAGHRSEELVTGVTHDGTLVSIDEVEGLPGGAFVVRHGSLDSLVRGSGLAEERLTYGEQVMRFRGSGTVIATSIGEVKQPPKFSGLPFQFNKEPLKSLEGDFPGRVGPVVEEAPQEVSLDDILAAIDPDAAAARMQAQAEQAAEQEAARAPQVTERAAGFMARTFGRRRPR